jgi:hypothetical protein
VDTRFLLKHRQKIEYLFKNVPSDSTGALEIQAHWAKYTCVAIYGYIENAVQELLRGYAGERCPPDVNNYVSSQLNYFQSANTENIARLLASFNKAWEQSLNSFLTDEQKAAVNSVVGNRNRIAHGLDVSVTLHQLAQWYPKVNEVIDQLLHICT